MEFLTYIWIFFSYFGDITYWLGFTVSFLFIYPFLRKEDRKRQRWILYYLLPTILLSYISTFFLKNVFKVPRICGDLIPCPSTYAFPSGHATIAFAFFMTIFLCFRNTPKIYLPVLILAFLVSYSRVALEVHTLLDVIVGAIVGSTISLLWYLFFKKVESQKDELGLYFRKIIHLGGVLIILLRLTIEVNYILIFVFALTLTFLISEVLRLKRIYLPVFHEISKFCKRKDEKGFLIEPFLFGLSICILLTLPLELFLIGSLPLVVGDALAGLIGTKFGYNKLPYNKNKSIEGSFAFFLSTFHSLLIFFDIKTSLILSIFSTVFESILRKYENILLPIGSITFYLLITKIQA